jgi:hypothetical protein
LLIKNHEKLKIMKRTANAHWTGNLMHGTGELSTQSTVLNNTQYSFKTRFADGIGTNPEELIAAALAADRWRRRSQIQSNRRRRESTLYHLKSIERTHHIKYNLRVVSNQNAPQNRGIHFFSLYPFPSLCP